MNGYFDSLLAETTSAQAANTLFSARSGEYFGVLSDDVYQNSPTAAFGAWSDLQDAKDNYSYESKMLDPEEANSLYGIKGRLKFDSPIREKAAQLMYQRKYGEIYRQQVLSQGTTMQNVGGFGVGMAASLLDPLNVASMFLPVVGEARLAQTLGSLGRFAKPAARGILGAAETGVVVAALQGPTALLLNEYQADYDMTTALRDTAFAAAAGGVLRVSLGGFGPAKPSGVIPEVLAGTKPDTQLKLQAQAAADLAQGKPVTGPQALIGLDKNILRAEAENSPEVAANFPEPGAAKDPTKPGGVREAPPFYDPDFKLTEEAKPAYTFLPESNADFPIVGYHGTPSGGFSKFETPAEGGAIFFSDSEEIAQEYTKKRGPWLQPGERPEVIKARMQIKNPLVIDALGTRYDNIPFPGIEWKQKVFGNLPENAVSVEKAARLAFDQGYDGLIVKNVIDSVDPDTKKKSTVYAVKSPEQIDLGAKERKIPEGYVKFETNIGKLKGQNKFKVLYSGDEDLELYAPKGAIRFDQALDFLSNSEAVSFQTGYSFKGLKDYWSYLVELGIKESDLDETLLKTGRTPAGRKLSGIQTNAAYLKDHPAFVITSSEAGGGGNLTTTGFDIPGLTTVPIKFKDIRLETSKGGLVTMRVSLTQRLLLTPEYTVFKHFVDEEKMPTLAALERLDGMNATQIDNFITNTKGLQEKARLTRQKAMEQITKKAIIANQAFGDLHEKNYGVKIPFKEDAPFEALILDKGAAILPPGVETPEQLAERIFNRVMAAEGLRDPKTGKFLERGAGFENERRRIINEALLEKLGKGKEDFIREQELRLAKEKIAKLEQDLANKKDESTWWQPGDEVPIETKAKESISQPRQGIIDDLDADIQKVSADTEDFIQRFKNEMSESDLNRLKEFDDLAKQAESAKPGFIQAALCVIRNLK